MEPQISRKKAILILIGISVVFIGVVLLIGLLFQKDTNQFGKFIKIQNYTSKIKNTSSDMRDATESYLYNIVLKNTSDSVNPSKIGDANIRDGSDAQSFDAEKDIYSGSYIVDMASIKQSYFVQYSYSDTNTVDVGGNPVVITCPSEDQLKYGEFTCIDFISEQSTENDILFQYLPYENFSFKLTPDATQGDKLVIVATLSIPESDLEGSVESKTQLVALYKNEVKQWFISKNLNSTDYIIQYNYDDVGNLIRTDSTEGD